jgi:hypothetical protein
MSSVIEALYGIRATEATTNNALGVLQIGNRPERLQPKVCGCALCDDGHDPLGLD